MPRPPPPQPGVRALLEQHAARLSEDVAAGSSAGGGDASAASFDTLAIDADVAAHLSSRDLFGGYSVPILDEPAAEAPSLAAAAAAPRAAPGPALAAASVAADGSASGLPPPSAAPPAAAWCLEAHPPFWTSTYGARGVLFHDGSPGRVLASLVSRLGDAHPWEEGPGSGGGGDDDAAECDWHAIAPPPPMPGGVGQGTGRWLMATLYSAGQWAGGGGAPPSAGGSTGSSKGRGTSGYSRQRRVTLRISAACDSRGPDPDDAAKTPPTTAALAAAQRRRARHSFSALRCVLRPAVPASSAPVTTSAPWEEACRVVWNGQLPVD